MTQETILKSLIGAFILVAIFTQEDKPADFCGCRYWEGYNAHPTVHRGTCMPAGEFLQVGTAPNHQYIRVSKWSPIFCPNEND